MCPPSTVQKIVRVSKNREIKKANETRWDFVRLSDGTLHVQKIVRAPKHVEIKKANEIRSDFVRLSDGTLHVQKIVRAPKHVEIKKANEKCNLSFALFYLSTSEATIDRATSRSIYSLVLWGLVSFSTRRIPKLRAESQQIAAWKLLYRVQHPARYVSRLQTIPSSDIETNVNTHDRPPNGKVGRGKDRSRRRPVTARGN